MTKKLFFILPFVFFGFFSFSQNAEGFWDAKRTTSKTTKIKAGESLIFKSEDFPTGTTEVLYRIKIVETNSKITESLVSVLKSIPDPTGISQGSAGVIFLTTTITGKDKFDYALFTNIAEANNFIKTKKTSKSCFQSTESSSEDSKIINFNNSCFNYKTKSFYFVISSKNWILDQSVLVETVPYVNFKLSRGWNEETKQEIIDLAKSESIYKSVKNQNGFVLQFKNYIENKHSFLEFQKLLSVEKIGLKEDAIVFALNKIGDSDLQEKRLRLKAENAILNHDFITAINWYENNILITNKTRPSDFYNLSKCLLATKQLDAAKRIILDGEKIFPENLYLQLANANYFLVVDDWKKYKQIYKSYSAQNLDATTSFLDQAFSDFTLFKSIGIKNSSTKKLDSLLKN